MIRAASKRLGNADDGVSQSQPPTSTALAETIADQRPGPVVRREEQQPGGATNPGSGARPRPSAGRTSGPSETANAAASPAPARSPRRRAIQTMNRIRHDPAGTQSETATIPPRPSSPPTRGERRDPGGLRPDGLVGAERRFRVARENAEPAPPTSMRGRPAFSESRRQRRPSAQPEPTVLGKYPHERQRAEGRERRQAPRPDRHWRPPLEHRAYVSDCTSMCQNRSGRFRSTIRIRPQTPTSGNAMYAPARVARYAPSSPNRPARVKTA